MRFFCLMLLSALVIFSPQRLRAAAEECVVILPDLYYRHSSPSLLANYLKNLGYTVITIQYPELDYSVPSLSEKVVAGQVAAGCPSHVAKVHYVGYLLGNVVLRQYLFDHADMRLGRVLLLEPPNKDTAKDDPRIARHPVYQAYFTDQKKIAKPDTRPDMEERVDYEPGVILANARYAGNKKLFSTMQKMQKMRKSASSGRKMKIPGLGDMIYVHALPQFAITRKEVIFQSAYFVQNAEFYSASNAQEAPKKKTKEPVTTTIRAD